MENMTLMPSQQTEDQFRWPSFGAWSILLSLIIHGSRDHAIPMIYVLIDAAISLYTDRPQLDFKFVDFYAVESRLASLLGD